MQQVTEVIVNDAQSEPLLGNYQTIFGVVIISRENGKMYVSFAGSPKEELGIASENHLFMKSDLLISILKGEVMAVGLRQRRNR